MPGEIKGVQEVSGCSELLTSEETMKSALRSSGAKPARNAARTPNCISVKNIIIASIIVVVVLSIVIISQAVKKPETFPLYRTPTNQGVACPNFWIGYREKCFYVSKEEKNRSLSLNICSSFNASLAVIDSQNELDFWVGMLGPFHYWFGLSREVNQVWKWPNGTEFKNQFLVGGEGFCAYINGKGADSTMCSMEKHFLCSRPESCSKTG